MFKKVLALLVFLVFFIFPPKVMAAGEFSSDVNVQYYVEDSGLTKIIHTITLQNLLSDIYATSYTLTLDNIDPQNAVATEKGKTLNIKQTKDGTKTLLNVEFSDAVVGKGSSRTFQITFNELTFAVRSGEVWEISIPRLSSQENFRNYNASLSLPLNFGTVAYITPKPLKTENSDGRQIYYFDKDIIAKTGVTAGFGAFQTFSFDLNYHLENPLNKSSAIDIAIPPDTSMQKVYYQTINHLPDNVRKDTDGNWLATYTLKPRERIDIETKGIVQIFAGPRNYLETDSKTLSDELKATSVWQSDNPQIKQLADTLQTPKAIYDYVWQNLSYDYSRVAPNVERLGAVKALQNPKSAICMEYTDLFIALARAAGIPAREINGFAYTDNPKVQPLSLVADVLHSWPEYWDKDKKVWTPVDPTWASTTGGIDYFSKLDLRHFAFVIHGEDSFKPYPAGSYKQGPNPQKDVFVNFGQLPENRSGNFNIRANMINTIPLLSGKVEVLISNPGPIALYNITPEIYFDDKKIGNDSIDILPPFSNYKMRVEIPFSFLARKTPVNVKIIVGDKQVVVPTNKNQIIIYNLILVFFVLTLILMVVYLRYKKFSLFAIIFKIKAFFSKIVGHGRKTNQETKETQLN